MPRFYMLSRPWQQNKYGDLVDIHLGLLQEHEYPEREAATYASESNDPTELNINAFAHTPRPFESGRPDQSNQSVIAAEFFCGC